MSSKDKTADEAALAEVSPSKVSQSEIDKARKEGTLEAAKEQAKESAKFLLDGNMPGEGANIVYPGHEEIMQWSDNLDLGIDAFKEAIAEDGRIPEEKVYGLLALERNGQNRTEYVKAMMKRLDLKADELPGGGPGYTNDVTAITKL